MFVAAIQALVRLEKIQLVLNSDELSPILALFTHIIVNLSQGAPSVSIRLTIFRRKHNVLFYTINNHDKSEFACHMP